MNRHTSLLAATSAVAAIGLAACGGGPSAEPKQSAQRPPKSGLANVDPCKIMTPEQMQAGGFTFQQRNDDLSWQPGCMYTSDAMGLDIFKNQDETVQSYQENGNWSMYELTKVNGRDAAYVRAASDTQDSCGLLLSAGGGVIEVAVVSDDPRQPIDCKAESMKIAQQIEPNLPE